MLAFTWYTGLLSSSHSLIKNQLSFLFVQCDVTPHYYFHLVVLRYLVRAFVHVSWLSGIKDPINDLPLGQLWLNETEVSLQQRNTMNRVQRPTTDCEKMYSSQTAKRQSACKVGKKWNSVARQQPTCFVNGPGPWIDTQKSNLCWIWQQGDIFS